MSQEVDVDVSQKKCARVDDISSLLLIGQL